MPEIKELLIRTNEPVAELNRVPGFDPVKLLQGALSSGKPAEGERIQLILKYKKLWFRLACPHGRIRVTALRLTEQMAIVQAEIFRDKDDEKPVSNFVASRTVHNTPGGLYIQAAEYEAVDNALTDAGFGIQLCDVCKTWGEEAYTNDRELEELAGRACHSKEEALFCFQEIYERYHFPELTGQYRELSEDLKAALAYGLERAGTDDGGTSNFDAPTLHLPGWDRKMVDQAAKQAGIICSVWEAVSESYYIFSVPGVGQGYLHCPETPVVAPAGTAAPDHAAIETVILQVLEEKGLLPDRRSAAVPARPMTIPAEQEREVRQQTEELIGEKGLSAMQHTIAAFRRH